MTSTAPARTWFDRVGLWLLAALALAPLVWCWHDFGDLFWFGDEWDQLDQISKLGFWRWTVGFFGENFAPLFKVVWGAVALGSHGSYFAIVVTVWLAHATCVGLLGGWMRQAGFGRVASAIAMLGLGLSASNVETLGWTVQLLTVQGMLCFLVAARWHAAREADGHWHSRSLAVLGLLVALSTFSFARGALAGGALAVTTLLSPFVLRADRGPWPKRIGIAAVCLVPACTLVALMAAYAAGNHRDFTANGFAAPATFATWTFLLNPFHRLLDVGTWGLHTTAVLGLAKIVLLAAGWKLATPGQRVMLLTLLVFQIGDAVLLGIGRHHTGLPSATASRYQYVSLLCTLPFAGVCVEALLRRAIHWPRVHDLAAAAILLALACGTLRAWPGQIGPWAERSRQTRTLILEPAPLLSAAEVTGVEWISNARARELARDFHLH